MQCLPSGEYGMLGLSGWLPGVYASLGSRSPMPIWQINKLVLNYAYNLILGNFKFYFWASTVFLLGNWRGRFNLIIIDNINYLKNLPESECESSCFILVSSWSLSLFFGCLSDSCFAFRWIFFIFALWFWNHTWTTLTLRPVSFAKASLTWNIQFIQFELIE